MDSEFFTFQKYKNSEIRKNKLTPSMEDYLEMIYRLYKDNNNIRINTLSQQLNVRMSSTTKIVQRLAKMGYVVYVKYGNIKLTEQGKKTGQFLLHRHLTIEKFLSFFVDDKNVFKDTEIIEHYISNELLENIEKLNNFFIDNPAILRKFYDYRKNLSKNL